MVASSIKPAKSTALTVFSGYEEYSTPLAAFRLVHDGRSVKLKASKEPFVPDPAFNPKVLLEQRELAFSLAELMRQSAEHAVDLKIYDPIAPVVRINVHFDDLVYHQTGGAVATVTGQTLRMDEGSVDPRTISHEFLHLIDPVGTAVDGKRLHRGVMVGLSDSSIVSEMTAEMFSASFLSRGKTGTERTEEIMIFYSAMGIDVLRIINAINGITGGAKAEPLETPKVTDDLFKYIAGGIIAVATFTKNHFDVDKTVSDLFAAKGTAELLEKLQRS